MAQWIEIDTRAGRVFAAATTRGICRTGFRTTARQFTAGLRAELPGRQWRRATDSAPLTAAHGQVQAYFDRRLTAFDLPLDLAGTPFQRAVWEAVRRIPFGEVRSYQQVAEEVGRPKAPRAVGNAMNACKVGLFIPCHRVVAAGGKIGGWGGDVTTKRWLIEFERGQAIER